VLYRSNAQSRAIEEYLVASGVNYKVYGGLRYFERAEIKDTLAYLRLITHPSDDVSFERVVNQPPRGIGDKTVSLVRDEARGRDITMWQAATELVAAKRLSGRANTAVGNFLSLIVQLQEDLAENDLPQKVEILIEASGLLDHFK